jgi:hypothetical protein
VGAFATRHSAPRSAAERPVVGWHHHLALLNRAHARKKCVVARLESIKTCS